MSLKFYLNKILKCDNIEHYSLRTLEELKSCYDDFIKKTGSDPDFPTLPMNSDGSLNIGADKLSGDSSEDAGMSQDKGLL